MVFCCFFPLAGAQAGSPLHGAIDGKPSLTGKPIDTRPICFTENRGQIVDTDGRLRPDILYSADAGAARLYFSATGVSYVFRESATESPGQVGPIVDAVSAPIRPAVSPSSELSSYRIDMKLVGSNSLVHIRAEEALPAYSNYYYPHCPLGITHVRSYARIVYENVYDDIDMVFAAGQGKTKYEFIVRPGGDPSQIRLRYDGAVSMRHAANGRLSIATPVGEIDEQSPYSYQVMGKDIPTAFVLRGEEVTFDVGAYDATKTLVIDPWATYYGGHGTDNAYGVAVDASGNAIVCGYTSSTDFPVSGGAQGALAGSYDIAIVKFSAAGSPLWATYYGGTYDDMGHDVAVNASGNIAVTGSVESWDFPVKNAMQQTIGSQGTDDAFLLMLDGGGSCLWATYLGGALSSGATMKTGNILSLGLLPRGGSAQGSLEIDVLPTTKHVTIFVVLEAGKRRFIDRRTIAVPDSITTAVDEEHPLPASCRLYQNYPNPFNPSTTISFELPRPMTVTLTVTDALGREVARLADHAPMGVGTHSMHFTADGLISAVYFYRLETPDAVIVKKMVVMK
jgi:hypothetical protein